MTKYRSSKRFLSIAMALTLAIGIFAAIPMSAHAVGIQNGMGTITVNNTTVGFAGQEWWVIGDGTTGVNPIAGHVTLLVKGGNPYDNVLYRDPNIAAGTGLAIYENGGLHIAMTNIL